MCLIVPARGSIQIAETDITVYKEVKKRRHYWKPIFAYGTFNYNELLTPFDAQYKPIQHLRIIHESWFDIVFDRIDEGFHSKTTKDEHTNVLCIIPKDAKYCYGTHNEIVSTKLIVFKHKWNYWWYKLWHR